MSDLTPLMNQYKSVKKDYPNAILFFRVGDFYEMFYEDAITASKVLQITLTSRNKGKEDQVPLCGVPYHAADSYITKLIRNGFKVAICEQVEDPKLAKGIVKRDVVRVITPGTFLSENALEAKENNFILSIYQKGKICGLAFADLSTGDFSLYETVGSLEDEIVRLAPKEILYPEELNLSLLQTPNSELRIHLTPYSDWFFDYPEARKKLLNHFRVSSLEGYGCEGLVVAISAAGALISYLDENLKVVDSTHRGTLENIKRIKPLMKGSYMFLDAPTQRNLELTNSLSERTKKDSLFGILDKTVTAMGGRLFKNWILYPLLDIEEINRKQDAVKILKDNLTLTEDIQERLKKVYDLERLIGRITLNLSNARDMIALKGSLRVIPEIKVLGEGLDSEKLSEVFERTEIFSEIIDLIEKSIHEDPPFTLREGRIIKNGYNEELDNLRSISSKGKGFIAELEQREKERTGINSLKVRHNKVFGYYIEVTKANLSRIPSDYMRKQTLVGAERFITPELKDYEEKVLRAEERILELEYEIFQKVREEMAKEAERIQRTAKAIAELDVLTSLAVVARYYNYCQPVVDEGETIEIVEGRHPVLERLDLGERFIQNDTLLDCDENQLMIITGPNMAGKSTYMRQVALIVLMAQIGSFIPAKEAKIGLVDRVFTRVGATDIITKGQSTFMVEMNETANILNNATKRSLIILDEIGRGTSTFDGVSIAWSVAEYIHENIKARTLFATHYHELTELALSMEGVKNYSISVKEWKDEIIFLRKIVEGGTDRSYGIQVARLAGLPEDVILRAKEVLSNLEKGELNEIGEPKLAHSDFKKPERRTNQLDIFTTQADPVVKELLGLDIINMTPLEALNKLYEFRKKLNGKENMDKEEN
ncbi:MAG: DNA mismatch repair protein MutS [Nitrospirota bacterium]